MGRPIVLKIEAKILSSHGYDVTQKARKARK